MLPAPSRSRCSSSRVLSVRWTRCSMALVCMPPTNTGDFAAYEPISSGECLILSVRRAPRRGPRRANARDVRVQEGHRERPRGTRQPRSILASAPTHPPPPGVGGGDCETRESATVARIDGHPPAIRGARDPLLRKPKREATSGPEAGRRPVRLISRTTKANTKKRTPRNEQARQLAYLLSTRA